MKRRRTWLIPLLWTLALGLWGLSRRNSVWRDEAATWQVARRSTADILRMLENVDVVHGLYYLFMHALFACFGPGTTVLRLPSVLALSVAAACVAVIGRRLGGTSAGVGSGLTAGLVLGLLPAVQFHLQEGRPYALVTAGAGISTLLLVASVQGGDGTGGRRARDREDAGGTRSRRAAVRWTAYGATVLVCGLLNWLSLLILPAHLVTLLRARAGREVWTCWAVASATAAAGVLPLVLFSLTQSEQVSWIPPLTWHMLIGPAVLLALGGIGALADRRATDRATGRAAAGGSGRLSVAAVGLPLLVVPHISLIGISLVRPLFLERYVLFSMLGLALLLGSIVSAAERAAAPLLPRASRWMVPATVTAAAVALLPQSLAKRSPDSRVDDVLATAGEVRRLSRPGDAVLYVPAARRDTRLVSPDAFTGLRDIALAEGPEESGTLKGVEASPARIREAMLAQQRIVLVTDAGGGPEPVAGTERDSAKIAVLGKRFALVADGQAHGRRVMVYERRTERRQ
ncbi:hypothetical protein [Streptomyces sp. NPDC058872]|uniref:glycosyltransferase family 39 protein n=1 Tax=Streptomyces sp. NPDC058872 TaxID=3346661 RepID=UPI003690BA6C